jgi:hypothetical protein
VSKLLKITLISAALGMAVTLVLATYLLLTSSTTSPPKPMGDRLFTTFVVLCPAALFSIPFIDAETGTGAFYVLWVGIGLVNAALYAGVGAAAGYLHYLLKSKSASPS